MKAWPRHAIGVYKTLGERCAEAREDVGLKQAAASRALGIRQSSLWLIENGNTKRLKWTTTKAMVKVYGVTEDWLVKGIGQKRPQGTSVVEFRRRPEILSDARYDRLSAIIASLDRKHDIDSFYGEFDGLLARWELAIGKLSPRGSQRAGPAIPRQARRKRKGEGG